MLILVLSIWELLSILVLMVHLLLMATFLSGLLLMSWWLARMLLVMALGLALEGDDMLGQVGDYGILHGHLALDGASSPCS